jgi:hypothetical protein
MATVLLQRHGAAGQRCGGDVGERLRSRANVMPTFEKFPWIGNSASVSCLLRRTWRTLTPIGIGRARTLRIAPVSPATQRITSTKVLVVRTDEERMIARGSSAAALALR